MFFSQKWNRFLKYQVGIQKIKIQKLSIDLR